MGASNRTQRGLTMLNQNIYAVSETAMHEIGDYFDLGDRRFRYAKDDGTGIALARMTAATAHVANYTDQVQTAYGITAGQKVVNVLLTVTVPAVDQFKNGYLLCNKGTGLGQMYRIRGNTAAVTPCVVTLYDEVITSVPAASELTIMRNKWASVCVFPSNAAIQVATGVPLVAVTANYYFWAQVKGPAPLLVDATATLVLGELIGAKRGASSDGAGDVPAATDQVWGRVIGKASEQSEIALVDLMLE